MYDLFLQSDKVKDLFLENGLVKLLCDLFARELRKKPDRESSNWAAEENIIGFLKAVSLYGCMTENGIYLLDEIVLVS
jgi:hypothetical protein